MFDVFRPDTTVVDLDTWKSLLGRLYIHFQIKDLLRQIHGSLDKDEQRRLMNMTTELALEHNLVTPFTSMVVVDQSG